ncbi:MAG: S8 family serine peptidase [Microscillaceae bacterium]|nr:S8 family serine peptidase [Microscillaceae bacterium]MDW8461162.1 S8 family serine peptidase [Cytophagales bacterium]
MIKKQHVFVYLCLIGISCYSPQKSPKKIRVSVWELYDMRTLPQENVWINTKEQPNGKDDDGNGFVDDVYGIGFDYWEQPTNHNYTPDYDTENKVLLRYFHGTAVANIVVRNNPNVELVGVGFLKYVDRLNEPLWKKNLQERLLGKPETDMALLDKMFRTSVEYFKRHKVRVVNISWTAFPAFFEKFLKDLEIYSPENYQKMCYWTQLFHRTLYNIFKENPQIMFVIAAGNENANIDSLFVVPAVIDLPNTITVGGLDKSGTKKAHFSNYGEKVKVYATAIYDKLPIAPYRAVPMEGTSFAAPVVTAYIAQELAKGKKFREIKEDLFAKKYLISK